ncbi:follicle cell protein 3C-1-like [Ctenocephalides felis]|uniref:follicle cell protein 3C-1-like n=1 Tax=Ctenocephalides felis TaxID=7515 RepID=UPI000E6E322C|nr:follicle cell protein 3C-1-like [Ctenocephalides felis]
MKYLDLIFTISILLILSGQGSHSLDDFESGLCQCAAFDSPEGEADRSPLLSQSPGVKVPCNEEGAASCKKLCLALARAAGARGPEVLCDAVSHLDSVKVAIFIRTCDGDWTYTGVTARDPICCHDNKPLMCPGQTSYPSDPEGCDFDEPTACDLH